MTNFPKMSLPYTETFRSLVAVGGRHLPRLYTVRTALLMNSEPTSEHSYHWQVKSWCLWRDSCKTFTSRPVSLFSGFSMYGRSHFHQIWRRHYLRLQNFVFLTQIAPSRSFRSGIRFSAVFSTVVVSVPCLLCRAADKGNPSESGYPSQFGGSYIMSKILVTALTRVQQRNFDKERKNEDIVVNAVSSLTFGTSCIRPLCTVFVVLSHLHAVRAHVMTFCMLGVSRLCGYWFESAPGTQNYWTRRWYTIVLGAAATTAERTCPSERRGSIRTCRQGLDRRFGKLSISDEGFCILSLVCPNRKSLGQCSAHEFCGCLIGARVSNGFLIGAGIYKWVPGPRTGLTMLFGWRLRRGCLTRVFNWRAFLNEASCLALKR